MLRYLLLTTVILTLGEQVHFPSPLSPDYSSDCALIINSGKYRPSPEPPALQYFANFLPSLKRISRGSYREICITYDDINIAIRKAKNTIGDVSREIFELSSVLPEPEHIAVSAEIVLEATKLLAHRYGLSYDVIVHGLPRIDTSKTAIKDVCPTFLRPVKCELSRYRTLSGMCNNLHNPSWGSARSVFIRYLPPEYGDGITTPRKSRDGSELPNARRLSFVMHHDVSEKDPQFNILLVFWGQMLDHDMTLAAPTLDHDRNDIECCKYPPPHQHPNCMNIEIPRNDPFFKFYRRRCLDFARILPGHKPGCRLGPRFQINTISAYIDASFVYGNNQDIASRLRMFRGGRLKSTSMYGELGLKDLLPMKTIEADVGCMARPRNVYCFDAGDERVNEQLTLTTMHTLWMREHNRLVDALAEINPHWDDETLYQEARHIVAALIQHISFNEFLPKILGNHMMNKYELKLQNHGYYDGYSPKINAGIRSGFQAAAFRFGHSLLPDVIERYSKFHEKIETLRISTLLRQPYNLYKPGIVDSFFNALLNQPANRMDPEVTTEVTNHLFEKPGDGYGMDLAAINIQRGRETGIPGFARYREYCGMEKVRDFHDLIGILPNKTVHKYMRMYKHVDDIDLWSAGISEKGLPGALLGPTFACLISEQFANLRRGDRFWYENSGWPSSFTLEQLTEIRKIKLNRLICDNSDDINTIQLEAMLLPDTESNPIVDCDTFPHIDLSKWRESSYEK